MLNGTPDSKRPQEKSAGPTIKFSGDLSAGPALVNGRTHRWTDALNITDKNITRFIQRGQWDHSQFAPSKKNHVKNLLAEYSVAMVGGKAGVVRWRKEMMPSGTTRDVLDIIAKSSFQTFHSDKLVKVQKQVRDADGKVSTQDTKVEATKHFFLKAKRFDGFAYIPHAPPEVRKAMNLWRGFGVRPVKGSWDRMQEHIFEVLTSGNEEQALYLVKWLAWAAQNPGIPAEVAPVLRESEGAGKGVFTQAGLRMFGIHGLHISNREHFIGTFNRHLMYTTFLFVDEAFWAGDPKGEGILKRMITEPTLTIEPKGLDTFQMPNCLHIIISSNEKWVVPAGKDARRFAPMDVSSKRIRDKVYFDALWEEMNGDGVSAMLYDLLMMDLGEWHPRYDIPQTDALRDQKVLSLKGVDALIYVLANEGKLEHLEREKKANRKTSLRANAVVFTGEGSGFGFVPWARRLVPSLKYATGTVMKRELIKEWGCVDWNRNGLRGVEFPRLIVVRKEFDKRYGPQNWNNPEMQDWEQPAEKGPGWHPVDD